MEQILTNSTYKKFLTRAGAKSIQADAPRTFDYYFRHILEYFIYKLLIITQYNKLKTINMETLTLLLNTENKGLGVRHLKACKNPKYIKSTASKRTKFYNKKADCLFIPKDRFKKALRIIMRDKSIEFTEINRYTDEFINAFHVYIEKILTDISKKIVNYTKLAKLSKVTVETITKAYNQEEFYVNP